MNVVTQTLGDVLVLGPEGKLDGGNSREFEVIINSVINEGSNMLLLDFSALDYISSSGLRVILATAKKLRKIDGGIALCHLNESIFEVFRISGFNSLLNIEETRDSALSAFF